MRSPGMGSAASVTQYRESSAPARVITIMLARMDSSGSSPNQYSWGISTPNWAERVAQKASQSRCRKRVRQVRCFFSQGYTSSSPSMAP